MRTFSPTVKIPTWGCGPARGLAGLLARDAVVYHKYSQTGGSFSPHKFYLVERNHYWVVFKTFPLTGVLTLPCSRSGGIANRHGWCSPCGERAAIRDQRFARPHRGARPRRRRCPADAPADVGKAEGNQRGKKDRRAGVCTAPAEIRIIVPELFDTR